MKVKVLYFAILRERMKRNEDVCEVSPGTTIAELAHDLFKDICDESFLNHSLMYGVNDEYVSASQPLKENDQISFIPPVAGG